MKVENRKIISTLGISITFPLLFIIAFLYDNEKIGKIDLNEIPEISNVTEYGIENVDLSDGNICLSGWLIETPNTMLRVDRSFILTDGNNTYKLNTIMQKRDDITERWNNGNNYDICGLVCNGLIKYLDKGYYRIGFLINDNFPYQIGFWNDDKQYERYYLTDEYLEVN